MDYIPADDTGFNTWLNTFDAALTAAPTDIGSTAGVASTFAGLVSSWNSAYALTIDPATRTSITIADKDSERAIVEPAARVIAQQAQLFPGTSDAERATFGLTIPDALVTPIAAPTSRPMIQVLTNASNQHTLRLRDEATPTSLAKPDGAVSAEIWVKIGGDAPTSVLQCQYRGDATRNPHLVEFTGDDTGKPAYYLARWKTARGLVGPESPVILATIAA